MTLHQSERKQDVPDYRGNDKVIIKIKRKMPSGNDIKGYHWGHYRKTLWNIWAMELMRHRQPEGLNNYYRMLTINRHYCTSHPDKRRKEREYDFDNYIAGMKPLIDSLKLNRLIEDDKPGKITHGGHRQIETSEESYVEIILEYPGG